MIGPMATAPAPASAPATDPARPGGPLRRDRDAGLIAGVCAGLGRRLGLDPLLVRVAFVAAATTGVGFVVYAALWIAVPAEDAGAKAPDRRLPARGAVEVGLGVGLLTASVLLAFRGLGLWFSDAIVWPVVLVAAGGALIWRQSAGRPVVPEPETPAPVAPPAPDRATTVSRTGIGAALVIAAGLVFLQATGALGAVRDAVLVTLVVAAVLGVIFAPWVLRLGRSLTAERASRIREQERAEMAAHLHDSVLQTLALVQRRADDPREVAALARRQERELRGWLAGRVPEGGAPRLGAALEAVASDVEHDHGVAVEVVAVGDAPLDERGEALVAAAREAVVNAAKFGGGSVVSVFAEAGDDRLSVFVRDRGPGFDPDAVPADRRGVRESIAGRMARHGGTAIVRSRPGQGTEVELELPRAAS
jgi:signal transduction histidine kinase/phage shock protein PspC (stress-responsive transcriptional regulator)